ncbi:MAG: beta-propeller domain-containing protein [Clostridiales bacterium]|nr:beta-propeller domain-containing protein [Clostridiales bacterium]
MKTYKERTQSILQKAEVQRKQKHKRITLITVLSSVAAVILALNLVLFVPYTVGGTDLTKYSSSEYYGVIQQLYGLTHEITEPRRTNNFNEWFGFIFKAGAAAPADKNLAGSSRPPTAPGAETDSSTAIGNNYQETTLNQTDGVTEADLFKRSDTHIFYLGYTSTFSSTSYDLRVYSIDGEDSKLITTYTVKPDKDTSFSGYAADREMYLSKDLSTITIISPCYNYQAGGRYTTVINVDVSNLSNIKESNRTYISGRYVSSRIADDNLLVISDFTVSRNANFDDVTAYVPQVGKKDSMKPLSAKDIVCPQNADKARYTVICSLDSDLEVKDSVALLSFSDDVYVSQNNLFATRTYDNAVQTADGIEYTDGTHSMTEIRIVPYDNGTLGDTRSITVDGTVLNRYSLDEYNGVLRAVTTINYSVGRNRSKCMLYCYDLDTLEVTAKVTDFAPVGESVKSARFYGDVAYVCTAETRVVITDPVFAFDLSDLNNITYTDTGTIPGYSLSLNKFADNTLLGIGYGNDIRTLKIELYEQTDSDVKSVATYEEWDVSFSSEFKAHLIDAKNGIIGLGISSLTQDGTRYAIFRYDGYDLTEIASAKTESHIVNYMRATVIDGYAYIFEDGGFHVLKLA